MKNRIIRLFSIFFAFFCIFVNSICAQNRLQTAGITKSPIEYQFPANGETDVQQQATLIVRPAKQVMQGISPSDLSFSIKGQLSGIHTGKVYISEDNQTVIFKPAQSFALNEMVSVNFEISKAEGFAPLHFSFQITSMSEEERAEALNELYLQNQKQEERYYNESLRQTKPQSALSSIPIIGMPLDATIDVLGTHAPGDIYLTVTKGFPSPYSFLATLNDTGVLFTRNVPESGPISTSDGCGNFQPVANNTFSFFKQQAKSPTAGVFIGIHHIMNRKGEIIDSFQCGNGQKADLHDFHLMPNGHVILIAYSPRTFDMKTLPCSPDTAKTNATVFDAVIQELDANKQVVMEWNSKDHFSICDATSDINLGAKLIDYNHINTAVIDSSDGNMIASFRHMDEVTKINWKTGATIWRWGGKNNMFTFEGDTLKFSHQHDPARIFNGNITMWDNGNLHLKDTMLSGKDTMVPFSRAIEYQLDEVNHKAKTVWEYRDVPYSAAAGNVQTLTNGNRLIGFGIVGAPAAIELTRLGDQIVYQLSIITNAFVYRAYRFNTPPVNAVRLTGTANTTFGIGSIYPNPSHSVTTMAFSVADAGRIRIEVVDILGHSVRTTEEKLSEAGTYTTDFDVHDLSPGTYYCKLTHNGNTSIRMMVITE